MRKGRPLQPIMKKVRPKRQRPPLMKALKLIRRTKKKTVRMQREKHQPVTMSQTDSVLQRLRQGLLLMASETCFWVT